MPLCLTIESVVEDELKAWVPGHLPSRWQRVFLRWFDRIGRTLLTAFKGLDGNSVNILRFVWFVR